jgi:hypothetical protein
MTKTEFVCSACGSPNVRRSRRTSALELPRMMLGTYPFRCLDCRRRVWINIWLFSRKKRPACPRCLALDVNPIDPATMRRGLWRRILVTLGAHGYRCNHCRRAFLAFKHLESAAPAPLQSPPLKSRVASAGQSS